MKPVEIICSILSGKLDVWFDNAHIMLNKNGFMMTRSVGEYWTSIININYANINIINFYE